jgi:hypothetical protein
VDAVHEWLVSAGVTVEKISQSVNKQWMQFDASASSSNHFSTPNIISMKIQEQAS